MNNNYYCIRTDNNPELNEIIIALLSDMPFDTFEEHQDGISAYIRVTDYNEGIEAEVKRLHDQLQIKCSMQEIESQNWNELWESGFQPLQIDDFCAIRADFHEPMKNVHYEIVIEPNMAFGTGHHETTRLMIQQMRKIHFLNKRVFDFGCGTAVLSILASKMGAIEVIAVDNEWPAFESCLRNAEMNSTPQVKSIHGTLLDVHYGDFDVILANINRNIVVSSLQTLREKLVPGGQLIISGFLGSDEMHVKNELLQNGLVYQNTMKEGDWISIRAEKQLTDI